MEWGAYYEKNGRYPVDVFMGCKSLSESLRDKAIMAELLKGTHFIPKTIKVTQENPRYDEMCRRFLADAEDFGNEKLKECGIDTRFSNENLDECLKNIISYIKKNLKKD